MYESVCVVLLTMRLFMFVSSSHEFINITGSCAETSNGEKIEVFGSNRSSISCYVIEDCAIPSKFNGPFVGKPANFHIEHTYLNRSVGSVPVPVFIWNPSTSGNDIQDLYGFQLIISPLLGNEYSVRLCRIFDLTNNTFVPDDHKLEFKVTLPGLRTGRSYEHRAKLSALPVNSKLYVDEQFTLPDVKVYVLHREPQAVDWTSEISYQIEASDDIFNLTLNFTLAPTEFGFRSYFIWLYRDNSRRQVLRECRIELMKPVRCRGTDDPYHIVRENATWTSVSLRNVAHDRHDVDRFLVIMKPAERGLCFVFQPSGDKETRHCQKTKLRFSIEKPQTDSPDARTIPSATTEHHQNPTQGLQTRTVGAIILAPVAMVLAVVFFICLKLKKSKSGVSLRKRTVYILSSDDHPCHVTAVQRLATYLEKHCHCLIYYPNWFAEEIRFHGVFPWIATHMDKADYTVVINSEAAFNIYNGRKDDIKYTAGHGVPETDSIAFALAHVRAKMTNKDFFERIIMAYFSYTDETFLLPFNPGLKYKIPEHLPKLLCHIHQLEYNEKDTCIAKFPSMGQLKRNTCGRAVLAAVDNAAQYQLKCPDWFSELYMIQDNDLISKADAEDNELTLTDNNSEMVIYDAKEFTSFPKNLQPESTPTIGTKGVRPSPSKIAAYDPGEFNCQITSLDVDSARFFLPPESMYSMETEEANQHLGHICLGSLRPRINRAPGQDDQTEPGQTKDDFWLEGNSEREALIKRENDFQTPCLCAQSDFFIAPESIAGSDACTEDVEKQLLCLNISKVRSVL